jgi:hypothetical protein
MGGNISKRLFALLPVLILFDRAFGAIFSVFSA